MDDKLKQAIAVGEDEAARLIGLSTSTLRSWRSQRRREAIPFVRAGRRVLYRVADLTEYLRANRVEYPEIDSDLRV